MLKTHDPIELAVEETYNAIMDLLIGQDVGKAVAVTALLHVVGAQFAVQSDDDARLFVERASEWIDRYFKGRLVTESLDESGYGSGI